MNDPAAFSWPDSLDELLIPDQAFSDAYSSMSDPERSWIKKNIAQLYTLFPPHRFSQSTHWVTWTADFRTRTTLQPRPWAVILLPEERTSPAQAVAAVLPTLTSRIPRVLIILRQRARWPAPLLTSLELCGAENVCSMGDDQIQEILHAMVGTAPQGVILALDGPASHFVSSEPAFADCAIWRPAGIPEMRIWHDKAGQWNWQALLWNYPGMAMKVWGPLRDQAPAPFLKDSGPWDHFLRPCRGVLALGSHLLTEPNLPDTALILTPGHEGCWVWPDLSPDIFLQRGMVLTEQVHPSRDS